MDKAGSFMLFGMFIILGLILSLGFASANTLVSGKIYNSDFTSTISGADVNVQCGSESLESTSLGDGTYAVTFSGDCGGAATVDVTASKGNLNGEGSSIINNSTQGEGESVAVANINIKAPASAGTTGNHHGGFYLCGNTVCDSGETHETCPSDCPLTAGENNTLISLADSNNSGNSNNSPNTTQGNESNQNTPGITGAVTGTRDGDSDSIWLIILGAVILLAIAIGIYGWTRGRKKESWDHM